MGAAGRPLLGRAGITVVDEKLQVQAIAPPVKAGLGDSVVARPYQATDQLEDPGLKMARHQQLQDVALTSADTGAGRLFVEVWGSMLTAA